MGLLNLFLQNKTALDVDPTPSQGNGPVGTPTGEFNTGTTPFQQVWDSNNTYVNSFIGGTNTGIQPPTLSETGLDIDDLTSIPSTTTPNTLTQYPAIAKGSLNQSALQFLQIWTPVINYNDVVVGASTSPLKQSLDETGLDVESQNSVLTTTNPLLTLPQLPVTPENLPTQAYMGKFGSSPSQYGQIYTPDNTYLNTFNPNVQQNTVLDGQTGLDNLNLISSPTTTVPTTPTDYGIPSSSPTGEFGGAPEQYNPLYGPNNTYKNSYINDIANFDTLQPPTLSETGLDVENQNAAPTTTVPTTNTTYPSLASGEFQGQSNNFNQIYTPNNTYLNTFNPNSQQNTILDGQTGLDNLNPNSSPTTTVPATSTDYGIPSSSPTGEFGSAPEQYNPLYGPNNTYENSYVNNIANFDTLQSSTLDKTGLDVENQNALPTTSIPNTVISYPQFVQGEFNGAPTQYTQIWNPTNQYIINYNPDVQPNTLSQTGLDNIDLNSVSTTTSPTTPTNYGTPSVPPLGEFGNAPEQYNSPYGPNNTYLSTISTLTTEETNPQVNTLDKTGLDNLDPNSDSTTLTPNNISSPTNYGIPSPSPLIQMGKFGGAPDQYITPYTPDNTYLNTLNPTTQQNTILEGLTGLDNTVQLSFPTTANPLNTLAQLPTTPVNLPPQTFMGEFQGAPTQFTQTYTPNINEGYLNNVGIQDPNSPQINTLSETGLDIENQNSVPSTANPLNTLQELPVTPQILPSQTFMGPFQGAPEQFSLQYNPSETYLDNYNTIVDDNSNKQVNTLDLTGLDTNNNSLSTTVTPAIAVATPTTLPPQTYMGEFGGAPSTFSNVYSPNNGYLNNISIQDSNSPQTNTLGETGLDNTDENHLETTSSPLPINVPSQPQLPLNVTVIMNPSGSAIQFTQKYKPSERYLDVIEDLPIGSK